MTGGSEDFQIVDSVHDGYRSDDRLDRLREIYSNETCKSAIDRTRRAESNAKALEAILEAQVNVSSESFAAVPPEELYMELEDTRARLVHRMKELESLRSEVSELRSQQTIDNDNIESLQQSLERLHRVAGEYRTDRDNLSSQLIELFTVVKNSGNDMTNISIDELKVKLGDGQLVMVDPSSVGVSEETSSMIGELEAAIVARDAAIAEKQSQIDQLELSAENLQSTINHLTSQLEQVRISNESLTAELVQEREQLAEYETKINEWSDWAANVTGDLEARNKEIELLEKFKEHAAEEIEILEERVKELSMASPPPIVDSSEMESWKSQINDLEAEKGELEKKIYEWSEWAQSMTSGLEEREKEIEQLKSGLTDNADIREQLENTRSEKMKISAELESVRETISELTIQVNAKDTEIMTMKSVEDELRRAEAKIANLNDQLLISENLVSGAAEQLETERIGLENTCTELRAKLAVRDSTISALSKEVDELKKLPHQDDSQLKQIQALEAELVFLRDQQMMMGDKEQEIHRLKGEVAFLNEDTGRMTASISDLRNSYEDVSNELEATRIELRNHKARVMELENRPEEPQIDEAQLIEERQKFESTIRQLENDKMGLGEKLFQLQSLLDESNARQSDLVAQVSELTKKVDEWTIWSDENQREISARDADIAKLESQLEESGTIAERLREQIRMLEDGLAASGAESGSPDLARLEAERADMEQKLIAWNKWADEVTGQLADRDATIADLMSGRDHLDESLRQAEELRRRVAELESTAVEREKNLADDSPIGKRLDNDDLANAQAEIQELRDQLQKAQAPRASSPGVVSSEEAEVLLDAYRAEIDRLSKENSKLRTEAKKLLSTSPSHSDTKPAAQAATSSNSWWNILPDIEETEDAKQ